MLNTFLYNSKIIPDILLFSETIEVYFLLYFPVNYIFMYINGILLY